VGARPFLPYHLIEKAIFRNFAGKESYSEGGEAGIIHSRLSAKNS